LKSESGAELSNNSALVLKARSLLQKKYRDDSRLFLVEGPSAIEEGLKANFIKHIFFTDLFKDSKALLILAQKNNVPTYKISERTLHTLCDTKSPAGIIAVAQNPIKNFQRDNFSKVNKLIYLDSVRDPGNAGTIVRTAAAFGMDGVIFSSDSVDPTNPKTVRATTGSIFQIPVFISDSLAEFKQLGFDIYLTDPAADLALEDVNKTGRQVWVFSNEAQGINKPLDFTHKVKISIRPATESLNVAQAATVVMFYLTSKI
jgi:RNA methyltransferase, TrmH family